MYKRNTLLLTAAAFTCLPIASARAVSLETHNNPVANGGIVIIPTDPDRSDWAGIPAYQDDVDTVLPVLSYQNITIAHDDDNFYFRMIMDNYDELDPQQSFFGAHHQILIDIDNDRSTGWVGGDGDLGTDDSFFAIGADVMIEGPAVWKYGTFAGGGLTNHELWDWGNLVGWGGVNFDDSPPSDIELQVARSTIFYDNPARTAFNFVALTTDGTYVTQEVYPSGGIFDPLTQVPADGEYFTYDLNYVAPNLPGDLNSDGYVGLDDLDIILNHWNQTVTVGDPLMGDVTGPGDVPDGFVGLDDLDVLLNNWNTGTPPTPSSIPEPATLALLGMGGLAVLRRRA